MSTRYVCDVCQAVHKGATNMIPFHVTIGALNNATAGNMAIGHACFKCVPQGAALSDALVKALRAAFRERDPEGEKEV